jgi:hypothetical protein
MSKVVKLKTNKISWLAWLVLVVLWNYGFPSATPFQDVIVAILLSLIFILWAKVEKNFFFSFAKLKKRK